MILKHIFHFIVAINNPLLLTGNRCEICMENYFRPQGVSLYDANVCRPCDCSPHGTQAHQTDCEKVSGDRFLVFLTSGFNTTPQVVYHNKVKIVLEENYFSVYFIVCDIRQPSL